MLAQYLKWGVQSYNGESQQDNEGNEKGFTIYFHPQNL